MQIGNFIKRTVFFLGWLLSPFTTWNDAFINIPIAYIFANLLKSFLHVDFLVLVVALYWITNGVGILLMYVSGVGLARSGNSLAKEVFKLLATLIFYSAILAVLTRIGIMKPFLQ